MNAGNLLTDKEKTWSKRDVVLPMNNENTMNRAGNSKENINYKETAANNEKEGWNFGTHEERRFGEFHTHNILKAREAKGNRITFLMSVNE